MTEAPYALALRIRDLNSGINQWRMLFATDLQHAARILAGEKQVYDAAPNCSIEEVLLCPAPVTVWPERRLGEALAMAL